MSAYREDEQGNLILDDGTVIPEAERVKAEVYSRVVGYLRPVEQWNVGKQAEFADRKVFRLASADDRTG
ncbi:MAG TPA: anaerobic ribonucleoside-triphosphate reductase [Candidatus Bipolaricaulis sp.]|nr:anaerobic ribonucleoside-triphosphate reductase [Candidatus Bipolaricaulis sp.]MDY0392491.1 anaerobic ribonucleoside-triphosphate reductase [Candidatus Bipolaricaulis sp.]HPD06413.1 anaerobic ribonucleoside-triphosphate reductase [Candidatus Bipolaricaulis sp.]HRS14117.1 anaerobic ribonucleoside-triphosphate reductase [Candidatus Bipolaricaulis sp.]HRU21810.1 anaerobic ribonucleoside-triphosphate reductase [Candidatus Bipolaricaulis sp.]